MRIRTQLLMTAALIASFATAAQAEEQPGYPRQFSTEARHIVATHCLNCGSSEGQAVGQQMAAPALPEVVHFASGSDKLDAGGKAIVKKVAADLKSPAFAQSHVIVRGFADSQGKNAENQRLSFHRALTVVKALEAEGVPAAKLTAQGFGADDPVGDNKTGAGRALNRRVTFEVVCSMGNPEYPRPVIHHSAKHHHMGMKPQGDAPQGTATEHKHKHHHHHHHDDAQQQGTTPPQGQQ
ncbi:MAG: OmpA family protein [Alphaproteobacteria bacterium]|nr:OmpA family protein [Alphaproteobacteria bacterium]MBV8549395.1 OmpA family protein [Alphaproteobacteria bacterium]